MEPTTRRQAVALVATLLVGAACSGGGSGRASNPSLQLGQPRIVEARTPEAPGSEDVSVDFGDIRIGASSSRELLLINDGDESITVAGARQSERFGAAFTYDLPALEVEPHQKVAFTVTFTPSALGASVRTLTLLFANARPSEIRLVLYGAGAPASLTCTPFVVDEGCSLVFRYVPVRERDVALLAFRNEGNTPLQFALGALTQPDNGTAPFSVLADESRFVITPGATLTFELAFMPTQTGAQSARLDYAFGPLGTPGFVALSGIGVSPKIEVSPSAIDFDTLAVGMAATRALSIANTGTDIGGRDDDVLRFAVPGATGEWVPQPPVIQGPDASEFALLPARDYGSFTIASSGRIDVLVTFSPNSAGRKNATLLIYSNDVQTPLVKVPLSGEAVDLPPCELAVTPQSIDFGPQRTYSSQTRTLTIANQASAPGHSCILYDLRLTEGSSAFQLTGGFAGTKLLAPGESLQVSIEFEATLEGTYRGQLEFEVSNPANPTVAVALSGLISPSCLFVAPRTLDFTTVAVGCTSRQRTITLYNTCTAAVTVTRVELQGAASPEFALTRVPTLPVTLSGGSSADFGVTFKPTWFGEERETVAMTATDLLAVPIFIPLVGKGVEEPPITDNFSVPEPPSIDYLFVVDDSISMADKQTALASGLADVIQYLAQQRIDYHIAVTTTDVTSTGAAGRLLPMTGASPRVLTPSTSDVERVFSQNANVGTGGSDAESFIYPAYLAVTNPLVTGHNAGFYRDAAKLRVVAVSDAADQDPLGNAARYYENAFLNLKGYARRSDFSFSAVCPTQAQAPAGCTYDDANAGMDARASTLAGFTGGRVFEICDAGWAAKLKNQLARDFVPWTVYFLSTPADPAFAPDPFVVSIDGQPYPQFGPHGEKRWDYDGALNAITFDPLAVPDAGSTITIRYHYACAVL